jgi:hypothetical protein
MPTHDPMKAIHLAGGAPYIPPDMAAGWAGGGRNSKVRSNEEMVKDELGKQGGALGISDASAKRR